MDRRAKKLEKKRKNRDQAKKRASVLAAKKPSELALLVRSAGRQEFGPCFVSAGWDAPGVPPLVHVVVTRRLPGGQLLPAVALVDRAGMGVKDAFVAEPAATDADLDAFVERVGLLHGGMDACNPLVAQSIVFRAIERASPLGFEPHPDFPAAMFGPRPAQLLSLLWGTPEAHPNLDDADDDDDDDVDADPIVHSALERVISRDGLSLSIFIYRGYADPGWILEVEDHEGGSTVWDDPFETDQAALDAALQAIEEHGITNFSEQMTDAP